MATDESLRLGVMIGTGQMAAAYARRWVSMPEVAFVAVSDVRAASRCKLVKICRHAGRLISARDQSRSTVVTAIQGALSPLIAETRKRVENLSTVEAGLRFARLRDAIKASVAADGEPVAVHPGPMVPRL
jgi:predicted homoserine dehydrogenase-like protein